MAHIALMSSVIIVEMNPDPSKTLRGADSTGPFVTLPLSSKVFCEKPPDKTHVGLFYGNAHKYTLVCGGM